MLLNLKMARFLKDLCLLSEVEYDNTNKLDFGMHTVLKIKLHDVILKRNLPRLIMDNSTSCASSLGTVDVSKLTPSI